MMLLEHTFMCMFPPWVLEISTIPLFWHAAPLWSLSILFALILRCPCWASAMDGTEADCDRAQITFQILNAS